MIVIGVAGGIASGKSAVCRVFESFGGVVINADIIGHEMLGAPHVRDRLIESFGDGILSRDGAIDRSALGRIVFRDQAARARLNAIVHPSLVAEIRRRIDEKRASGFDGIVVVDAALLVEWGATDLADVVVIVTAPESMRIARLMERNGLSAEEAAQRIHAQISDEIRRRYADYVIDNRESPAALEQQARDTWQKMVKSSDK